MLSLLALAKECEGIGADISTEALKVAKENLEGISKQCERALAAKFVESDLFTQFDQEQFDVIVSNPPYIASAVIETLELTDLPSRPERTTRLRITAVPVSDEKIEVQIRDLGFGEIYRSTDKTWKYTMTM